MDRGGERANITKKKQTDRHTVNVNTEATLSARRSDVNLDKSAPILKIVMRQCTDHTHNLGNEKVTKRYDILFPYSFI